jgi:uncharacterized membrane protein YdjX (TVP38/TMEM64 family)/rhodanese-related sulfurtransferase
MNRRGLMYRLILAAALFGAIAFVALHRDFFQAGKLEHELERFGHWAPILFVLFYAAATVMFVPGSAFSLAGGALFGPLWGTIWNLTGATIGASLAFLTARYLASEWVTKKSGERLGQVIRGVEAEGWRFIAFVRLVPLFPFNLLNYALGLTRAGFGIYVLTSAICMVPGALAYTWLGYAGRQAVSGAENIVRDVLIAIGVLAAAILLPRLVRRFRGRPLFIEATELRDRLKSTPETVVIDVRTPEEFNGPLGHILGARNIPVGELPASLESRAEMKNTAIVLVCKSDKRSAKGAVLLRDAGFAQVSVLRGGMENWKRNGYPVESRNAA